MKRLLLLILFLPFLALAEDKLEEQWYSLLLEGQTVGFLHQTTRQTAGGLLRSEIEQTMEIRRFGMPFSMTQTDVWTEQISGELVSVSSELDMNGQRQMVEARAAARNLEVHIRRGDKEEQTFLPFEEQPRGLFSIDREIAALIVGREENGELSYRLFSPETLKIEEFRVHVLGPGEATDSLGRRHRGILVEERSSSLPGVVTTEVYDVEARFLYSKTPVGLELEILRLENDPRGGQAGVRTAEPGPAAEPGLPGSFPGGDQKQEAAAVFDVASLTVPVEGLEDLSVQRTEALTVAFRGEGVPILYESVRSAEEDLDSRTGDSPLRIVSVGRNARQEVNELVLDLANRSAADSWGSSRGGPIPQEAAACLEGGFHLDLDDPRLAVLLDRCGDIAADSRSARCLERLVASYIRNKSLAFGFADLEEVLSKREGDCTEHALLLVALLRKAGIPSRMAYGLILAEAGLIGHAWVELYGGGRWHWLDPSFPGGRPYGLKIRLGVMDPAEPVWASLSLALLQVAGSVEGEILEAKLR